MCGIFGILNTKGKLDPERFQLPNPTSILAHRGPDDHGHYLGHQVYLGHRRLSIIDLATGQQPMHNEDGSLSLIFNGEIYNFHEIREALERLGHRFQTNSDTETILHAYEEWGRDCLERFRGMFAFAIWDSQSEMLFIARDRLGIKPLFYALHNGVFYFASEMKAILQYSAIPHEMDADALAAYMTLAYIPAPLTIYRHIRKLPAGHTLEISGGDIRIQEYWDLSFRPDYSKSKAFYIDGFMNLLEEAVKLRLISDVPLGAFLSGGIDSGTVVALMSGLSEEPVRTCCIGFEGNIGGYLDERGFAQQIVDRYHTHHIEHMVAPDLGGIIGNIVEAFDEPFADHSTIPSYYLCKVTREKVSVALSGLGGDELFGGYERYLGFQLSALYGRLPVFLRERVIREIVERLPERADGHYTINHMKRFVRSASQPPGDRYLGFLSMNNPASLLSEPEAYQENFDHCRDMLIDLFEKDPKAKPIDRAFYCDIKTWLPEDILACTDRMSMAHGLEVRVPFLDHKLMEFCATIPAEMKIRLWEKKHILKRAVAPRLPKEVIYHRKQGFVGPMSQWLRTDLRKPVEHILSRKNLEKHGLFDPEAVARILDEHFNRVEIRDKQIWSLVMFQAWYNRYMDGSSS
jgi:asparagine synthase (glutamine-hydrolysing)